MLEWPSSPSHLKIKKIDETNKEIYTLSSPNPYYVNTKDAKAKDIEGKIKEHKKFTHASLIPGFVSLLHSEGNQNIFIKMPLWTQKRS